MEIMQWIYTSSKKGQNGYAGFGIWATSGGITDEETDELRKLGTYYPPNSLPARPTAEALDRLFPVIYRSGWLSSGRFCLLRSAYAGKDYSNRWGNYLVHALVFEKGTVPEFPYLEDGTAGYPIDFTAWKDWKKTLSENEDNGEIAPPLPPLTNLMELDVKTHFPLPVLAAFLNNNPARRELFVKMLSAIFYGRKSGRRLVISDEWANALSWMACLQKAFPSGAVNALSFCTFLIKADYAADVNIVVPDSSWSLDDAEACDFFDLVGGRNIAQLLELHPYAQKISELLTEKPMKMRSFLDFSAYFILDFDEKTLMTLLNLFEAVIETESTNKIAADAVFLIVERARPETFPFWAKYLVPIAEKFDDVPPAALEKLCSFALKSAENNHDENLGMLLVRLWISLSIAVLSRNEKTTTLSSLREKIGKTLPPYVDIFDKTLVTQNTLRHFVAIASKLNPESALYLGQNIFNAIAASKGGQQWEDETIIALIEALAPKSRPAFTSFIPMLEDNIVSLILKTTSSWGEVLYEIHKKILPGKWKAIRSELESRNLDEALLDEYRAFLESSQDVEKAYKLYMEEIKSDAPVFWEKCRSSLHHIYLENLPYEQRMRQCETWLVDDLFHAKLGNEYAGQWLKTVVNSLPLSADQSVNEALVTKITSLAEELNVVFQPNIPSLRKFGQLIGDKQKSAVFEQLKDIPANLTGIDEEKYKGFLYAVLKGLLLLARSSKEVKDIMEALAFREHATFFYQIYFKVLRQILSGDPKGSLDILILDYWFSGPQGIFEEHLTSLAEVMEQCTKEHMKGYRAKFAKSSPSRWKQVVSSVKKPGFVSNLLDSFFGSKK